MLILTCTPIYREAGTFALVYLCYPLGLLDSMHVGEIIMMTREGGYNIIS
jgi:hypothetical protein